MSIRRYRGAIGGWILALSLAVVAGASCGNEQVGGAGGVAGTDAAAGTGGTDSSAGTGGTDAAAGTSGQDAGADAAGSGGEAGQAACPTGDLCALSAPTDVETPSVGPALGWQGIPVLAYAQGAYLAAWEQRTPDAGALEVARLDASGRMLDPAPTRLSAYGGGPGIATDGKAFFIAWSDSSDFATQQNNVLGAVVPLDGSLTAPAIVPIARTRDNEAIPRVAWTGTKYLVTYLVQDSIDDVRSFAVFVDANGKRTDDSLTGIGNGRVASVTAGADQTLVTYVDQGSLRGRRVTASGAWLDPGGFAIASSSGLYVVSTTWTGSQWFVVWRSGAGVYGTLVDTSGAAQSAMRVDDAAHPGLEHVGYDAVTARLGSGLLVAYWESGGVALCRLTAGAKRLGCRTLDVPGSYLPGPEELALASGGQDALLAYASADPLGETELDVLLARIGADGAPIDSTRRPLPPAEASQLWPAVAAGPAGRIVLWCDSGGQTATWNVRGAPIDDAGKAGQAVVIGQTTGPDCWPTVTRHADGYLAAWVNGKGQVLATRLDTSAHPLDSPPLVLGGAKAGDMSIGSNQYAAPPLLAAAWNGSMSLVVWTGEPLDETTNPYRPQWVQAVRVAADGGVLDATPIFLSDAGITPSVAVVGNDQGFVVLYVTGGFMAANEARAVTVASSGALGESRLLGPGLPRGASILPDADGYLVAWTNGTEYTFWLELARLAPDGSLRDPPWTVDIGDDTVRSPLLLPSPDGPLLLWGSELKPAQPFHARWWSARLLGASIGPHTAISQDELAPHLTAAASSAGTVIAYDAQRVIGRHAVLFRTLQ